MQKLIATDCHISPPFSVLDELPESYRQYFRRVERRADGDYLLEPVGSAMMGMQTAPATKIEGDAAVRVAVGACDEANPSFEPADVLAELERDGVYGAVLISRISAMHDTMPIDADIAYCKVINDWNASAWNPTSTGSRPASFSPTATLPHVCAKSSVAPRWVCVPRCFPTPTATSRITWPWEPLWEAANSLKIPITMHVGGTRRPLKDMTGFVPYRGLGFVGWYNQCVGMGETLGWLTFSGVFERYPDLHVIMTEGYAGWLAFAIQFFDHHWNDSRFGQVQHTMGDWAAHLEMTPGYYLKRQAHATFMWDPAAIQNRNITGIDCLLWGNDYPHREGSFPDSQEWIAKQFAGVPQHEVDAMTGGTAAKLFGITLD